MSPNTIVNLLKIRRSPNQYYQSTTEGSFSKEGMDAIYIDQPNTEIQFGDIKVLLACV